MSYVDHMKAHKERKYKREIIGKKKNEKERQKECRSTKFLQGRRLSHLRASICLDHPGSPPLSPTRICNGCVKREARQELTDRTGHTDRQLPGRVPQGGWARQGVSAGGDQSCTTSYGAVQFRGLSIRGDLPSAIYHRPGAVSCGLARVPIDILCSDFGADGGEELRGGWGVGGVSCALQTTMLLSDSRTEDWKSKFKPWARDARAALVFMLVIKLNPG